MSEKITLNLIEYQNGSWGFVGHIPEPFRVIKKNEIGQDYADSKHFTTEHDAVTEAITAGYDVRVYRKGNGAKR